VNPAEPILGALYLRQSSDRNHNEAAVTRQREDCQEVAGRRGIELRHALVDNDTSAAGHKPRPGFDRLLELIGAGEVQAVVAWSLDRLTRNRRDTVRLIETCQRAQVSIVLVRGSDMDLSAPAGRLAADILASVARHEIEQKADRQRRAQQQAAADGRRVGGRRPFGYEQDGVTVRDREAAAVRDGYRAVLAGVSLGEVAREWNRQGFTTGQSGRKGERKGRPSPWQRGSVRDVLLNPRNAGLRGYAPVPERGRRKVDIVGPARWPALVDEATYRATVGLLSDPQRRTTATNAQALLTGVATCGVCGASVHAGGASKQQQGWRTYRCSGSTGHVARRADPVDQLVGEVIIARLSQPDARDLLVDRERPDVDALRTKAMALRARLDQLATDFADGVLTASQLRTATERVRSNLAAVEAQMTEAGRVDVLGPLVNTDDVRKVWEGLSVARQRRVIDVLMKVVIHSPGRGTRIARDDAGRYDLGKVAETVRIEWRQP
jgi:DNA invertase Pin-like site-specific DNA recombinase